MNEPRTYYEDVKDGDEIGDIYHFKGKAYEVIDIEGFNQLMVGEGMQSEKN